jgi:SAM-dependent methyltransferase
MADTADLRSAVRSLTDIRPRPCDQRTGTRSPPAARWLKISDILPELLAELPTSALEAFAGVSNVGLLREITEGATILDLGCGVGLDTFIAAHRTGPAGSVVAIDFSEPTLARARTGVAHTRVSNVLFCRAYAEKIPLRDESVDLVIVKTEYSPGIPPELRFSVNWGASYVPGALLARN